MYSSSSSCPFQSPTTKFPDEDYKKLIDIKSNLEKFIDPFIPSENVKRAASKNRNHSPNSYSGQKENLDSQYLLFQQIEKLTLDRENAIVDLKKVCEALVSERQRNNVLKEKLDEYEKIIQDSEVKKDRKTNKVNITKFLAQNNKNPIIQGSDEGTFQGLKKIIYQKDLEINGKELELEEYKKFCKQLEEDNRNLIAKIKELKSTTQGKKIDGSELTNNYEQRLMLLIKENERISVAYEQRNEEIDSINLKMKIIERERNEEIEELQKQLKKSRLSVKEENELLLENRIYKEKLLEFEGSIKFLKEEIERLSEIINKQQEECDFWKEKAKNKSTFFKNSIYNSNDSVGTKTSNSANFLETPNKLIENYRNVKNELDEQKGKSQFYEALLREKQSAIEVLSAELQKNNQIYSESVKRKGFELNSSPIKTNYNY